MHDVVILGAGMAGMACARRLAQRGLAALLVAPGHNVANRGETLSFRAGPVLDQLGWTDLLDADTALACAGRYSIWGSAALRRDDRQEQSGWHLDRAQLEARMMSTLDSEQLHVEARQVAQLPDHASVTCTDGSTLTARYVIDCTGRAALSAGAQTPLRRLDRLAACYTTFDLGDDTELLAATLVEAVADGWWYMSAMPGGRCLLCFFTDTDLMPAGLSKDSTLWAQLLAQTTGIAARLDSLGLDPANCGALGFAAASTVTQTILVEPRLLRAGDAAIAQDPLGSNGLATALWSGVQAADSVMALLDGDAGPAAGFEQAYLDGIQSFLANQHAMYASERRFPEAPFWQRRHANSFPPHG